MRGRVLSAVGLWAIALASVLPGFSTPAFAQPSATISIIEGADGLSSLLRQGQEMELQRRWSDATAHYEDAMRRFPGDASLQRRFEFARMHYDLGRRYADRSFCQRVLQLQPPQALDLYAQVLLKIQAHYVEVPNWKELVERGTNNLEVALSEQAFVERNLPAVQRTAVDEFRGELRRVLGPLVVGTRADARSAVGVAADLAQKRLGVPVTAAVLEYLCGATNALDPYSAYLTPDQLRDVFSQIDGNFVGLGIELKAQDGALLIVRVIPGSPAEQGGVRAGDRIVAVNGQPTRDLSTDQAANLLQGEEGTVARLAVASGDAPARLIPVRRQRVEVPGIDRVSILDPDQGVGYLRLLSFQKTTVRDLESALWQLHGDGMKSLIIDLRGNPGGLLTMAVDAADLFLERGIIVSTRGRNVQEDFTYSAHAEGTWRVPLVLLIDQDSASAAEIFAGAIRDHRRGTLVGVRSYGKGSVQGIFPLESSEAGVRLTTAKFYSPSGRPYSLVGVEPDVVVHMAARPAGAGLPAAAASPGDDPMLTAALQTARNLLASR